MAVASVVSAVLCANQPAMWVALSGPFNGLEPVKPVHERPAYGPTIWPSTSVLVYAVLSTKFTAPTRELDTDKAVMPSGALVVASMWMASKISGQTTIFVMPLVVVFDEPEPPTKFVVLMYFGVGVPETAHDQLEPEMVRTRGTPIATCWSPEVSVQ